MYDVLQVDSDSDDDNGDVNDNSGSSKAGRNQFIGFSPRIRSRTLIGYLDPRFVFPRERQPATFYSC